MITLATLSSATEQEVFDQVVNHLKKQKVRCVDDHQFCSYRDSKGLKCAAGCLIGDDEYIPEFEKHSWHILVTDGKVPACHAGLIAELQTVHDVFSPISLDSYGSWKTGLAKCAKSRGLKFDADNFA